MSVVNKTTQGGADFKLLCTGAVRNYSFNPADLSGQRETEDIKQKLIAQLEDTVRELELQSERTIAKIYIGKTYILLRKKPGGGYLKFDPLKHHTWKKNGISSRWQDHKKQDYGRDGLVVLGAITRETMPERCSQVHQEHFALAMEQQLLHHYRLSHYDPRVVNETFSTEATTTKGCYAYAVYMAFRYEDETFSEEEPMDTSPSFPIQANEHDQSTSSAHRPTPFLNNTSYMNSMQPSLATSLAVRIQQQEADQTAHPSSLPTMSQPAPSYTFLLPSCRSLVMSVNCSPNSRMISNNQPRTQTNSQQSATIVNKPFLVQRPSHTSHHPTPPQAARANPLSSKSSAIPNTVPGPSHTTSAPEQSQERSTKCKRSTSSTSVSLSLPPNYSSIPFPSSSAKGAKRSHKQTRRTNSQPTNIVPAQNAHQSKRQLQDPKDNMSRKRSQTSSSQTPSKKAKLASNATSNAPGTTLSQDALLGEDFPQTDSPPDDTLLDSPPVSQSTREDSGPSCVNSDSSGSE